MLSFGKALIQSIRRVGIPTIAVAAGVWLLLWLIDQFLGNIATNYLNSKLLQFIKANPGSASVIAGVLFLMVCAAIATRDEFIRKYAEFRTEIDHPAIEILWRPGKEKFVHHYQLPPNPTVNTHYRVCVHNKSKRTEITKVRVSLERMKPHVLPCVPCRLRLMNNILPANTAIEEFSLNPGEERFVDVMAQEPNGTEFWIWHTVQQIDVRVPAQAYIFTILVTASNSLPTSKQFELVKNGLIWDLKAID